jgi:hypothetical protein
MGKNPRRVSDRIATAEINPSSDEVIYRNEIKQTWNYYYRIAGDFAPIYIDNRHTNKRASPNQQNFSS